MRVFRSGMVFGLAVVVSLGAATATGQDIAEQNATNAPASPVVNFALYSNSGDWIDQPEGQLVGYNSGYGPGDNSSNDSQGYGNAAGQNCDSNSSCPTCENCPTHGIYAFVGYESFRSIVDGAWGNNGINTGVNFGTRLGSISDLTGIGFQIGGSVGAYDWAGNNYRFASQNRAETQGFVTYGFFRKANEQSRWTAAVVQDWMINDNYGEFAQNPTLSQVRMQIGYDWSALTEIGLWGAFRVLDDSRLVGGGFGTDTWRPVDQLSVYWNYLWGAGGADSFVWFGIPERDRLSGNGSLGNYFVGALTTVPLSDRISLYALVTYMHQSAAPGPIGSTEDAWDFTIGLAFYPHWNSHSSTIAGQCWMPAVPVANNGTFLVDTNRTF